MSYHPGAGVYVRDVPEPPLTVEKFTLDMAENNVPLHEALAMADVLIREGVLNP